MTEKLDSTMVRRGETIDVDGVKESRSVSSSDSIPTSLELRSKNALRETSGPGWTGDWALQLATTMTNPLNPNVSAAHPA